MNTIDILPVPLGHDDYDNLMNIPVSRNVNKSVVDKALREFNETYGSTRPWNWTDPLQEGMSGIVRNFGTLLSGGRSELDRLQYLQELDNEQWQEAIKSGLVNYRDIEAFDPLGINSRNHEARRSAIARSIERMQNYQNTVDNVANYIAPPTPHTEPEGALEQFAYGALGIVPDMALMLGEYKALGGLTRLLQPSVGTTALIPQAAKGAAIAGISGSAPITGAAATAALNTAMGNQLAREQVYSNLVEQGKKIPRALESANSPGWNLADLLIRGGTTAAGMYAFGKPINPYNYMDENAISPLAQLIRNTLLGASSFGAGDAAAQALTNYRSNIDNNLGDLATTALKSGGTTALLGLATAATNWRNLRDAQDFWRRNRPINAEYTDLTPANTQQSGNNNYPQLTANSETPPVQPNNNPTPPNNVSPSQNDSVMRYNKAVMKRGFSGIATNFSFTDSINEIGNAIRHGFNPETASQMFIEAGINPETANIIVQRNLPPQPVQPQNTTAIAANITHRPLVPPEQLSYIDDPLIAFRSIPFGRFDPHLRTSLTRDKVDVHRLRDSIPVHSITPGISDAKRPLARSVPLDLHANLEIRDGLSNIPRGTVDVQKFDFDENKPEVNVRGFNKELLEHIRRQHLKDDPVNVHQVVLPRISKPAAHKFEQTKPNVHSLNPNSWLLSAPTNDFLQVPPEQPKTPQNVIPLGNDTASTIPTAQPQPQKTEAWKDPLSYRSSTKPEPTTPTVNNPTVTPPAKQQNEDEKKPQEPQQTGTNTGKTDARKALDARIEQEVNTHNPVYTDNGSLSPRFNNAQKWFSNFSSHVQREFANHFKGMGVNIEEAVKKLYDKYSGADADSYDNYGFTPAKSPAKSPIVTPLGTTEEDYDEPEIISTLDVEEIDDRYNRTGNSETHRENKPHRVNVITNNDPQTQSKIGENLEFFDDNGDTVAQYYPHIDYFRVMPEFEKTGWVRNLEGEVRKNLPNLLKAAGMLDEKGNLKPDGYENSEYRRANGYHAWKPSNETPSSETEDYDSDDEEESTTPSVLPFVDTEQSTKPKPQSAKTDIKPASTKPSVTPLGMTEETKKPEAVTPEMIKANQAEIDRPHQEAFKRFKEKSKAKPFKPYTREEFVSNIVELGRELQRQGVIQNSRIDNTLRSAIKALEEADKNWTWPESPYTRQQWLEYTTGLANESSRNTVPEIDKLYKKAEQTLRDNDAKNNWPELKGKNKAKPATPAEAVTETETGTKDNSTSKTQPAPVEESVTDKSVNFNPNNKDDVERLKGFHEELRRLKKLIDNEENRKDPSSLTILTKNYNEIIDALKEWQAPLPEWAI